MPGARRGHDEPGGPGQGQPGSSVGAGTAQMQAPAETSLAITAAATLDER